MAHPGSLGPHCLGHQAALVIQECHWTEHVQHCAPFLHSQQCTSEDMVKMSAKSDDPCNVVYGINNLGSWDRL